jgi:hypothetical protein
MAAFSIAFWGLAVFYGGGGVTLIGLRQVCLARLDSTRLDVDLDDFYGCVYRIVRKMEWCAGFY